MTDASTANSREPIDTRTWLSAAASGDEARVKALLAAGADVNATSEGGETALMRAASKGHLHVVQILLEAGADPNARREDGFTALGVAVFFGYADIVRALLACGADPSANGRLGTNAEKWALFSGFDDIAEMLREPGSVRARGAASEAASSAEKSEGPELFPAEGTFSPVVPLAEIYEASAAPENSEPSVKPKEVSVDEIADGAGAELEPQEQEVTTLIRARKNPATLARLPTHAFNPRRARKFWPRKASVVAALVVAGLFAGAFTGLVAGGYWNRARHDAEVRQPAPPAADAAPLEADAAPANEAAPPQSSETQNAAANPDTQTSQPASQISEPGGAAEPESVAASRADVVNDAEAVSGVERVKRDRPASQPAPTVKTSEAVSASRAEPAARREVNADARAGRTTPHAVGEKTADVRRVAAPPRRPRRSETQAVTPSPRENTLPVFSPKPSGKSERKVIPWP